MNRRKTIVALAIANLVLLSFTLVAACSGGGTIADADPPEDPPTHITATDLAERLKANDLPGNIDWVRWYIDGQSEDIFPLDTRTPEEIARERREMGRPLITGTWVPPGTLIRTQADMALGEARRRVLRKLSEPKPGWTEYEQRVTEHNAELERTLNRLHGYTPKERTKMGGNIGPDDTRLNHQYRLLNQAPRGTRTSRPATTSSHRCSRTTSSGWASRTSCRRRASMCWRGTCRGMRSTWRSGRSWTSLGGSRGRRRNEVIDFSGEAT